MRKIYRDIARERGKCLGCGQVSVFLNEKYCPDCATKSYEHYLKRDKQKYNKYMKEYHKKKYDENKVQGLCVRCGNPHNSKTLTCPRCLLKIRESRKIRFANKVRKSEVAGIICRFCDNQCVPGYLCCEYHLELNREKARLPQTNKARKKLVEEGELY